MKTGLTLLLLFIMQPVAGETGKRLITIGGALTEIVYQLEKEALLVGSDTTSYYPAAAEQLPKVGYQRTLSAEGILSLNPDLIIYTDEAGPPAVLEQLKMTDVGLLELKAGRSLEDVIDNIKTMAETLDATARGQALIQELMAKKQGLDRAIAAADSAKKVMFILQHRGNTPLVAGKKTAADSIITLSGADNAVSDYEGYRPLTPEAAITQAPDIILITRQTLEHTGGQANLLKAPGLALTPAGIRGHVIAMDALLMIGFGPRIVDAALELHERYSEL